MQYRFMQVRVKTVRALVIACSLVISVGAVAADKPGKAAIASAHPLATEAGLQILREGGNAFDAAVAVAGALSVVEPTSSGLGGGGFFLIHRARDNFDTMIDAREVAPQAATRDMYLDKDGNVVRGLSTNSALAAGIPGEPAGMVYLAEKYGKLPLSKSLQPAIKLAEEGFPLYTRLRGSINARQAMLSNSPAGQVYLRDGKVPDNDTIIKQPDLAQSLRLLAQKGNKGFYEGPLAEKLVNGVRSLNGIWTLKDLTDYRVKERKPVIGEYRGAKIISAPPPSSGGVALIDALNILSGFDLHGVDSATRKHLVIEAMRRVHRDRAQYLGDPDFVSIPVEQLIHPFYAAGQRAAIRMDRAMPSDALPGVVDAPQGTQTTHFSVIDSNGNRVGATLSINFFFGSGIMIPGTGILLNNEMDDFSSKPGIPNGFQLVGAEANAIAPGKRMLSSMTPTFVETKDGLMVIGTPGGSRIIGMVLLGVLEWLDGKSAEQVVALPRFHHQYLPDAISHEANAFTADEKTALTQRGHNLREMQQTYGNLQVVTWDKKSGEVKAASDPRGVGVGLVY
jgi:gamma-glutamyltranspeptidase / glutathione hydrolase